MQEFDYLAPVTVAEAVALLAGGSAKVLAGGSDLIPQVRERRRRPGRVVDLKKIAELTRIERMADGGWRIGAAVSIGRMGREPQFAASQPALLESARLIGSLQVQNRASLGGNLCNAAPSADAVPLMISLGLTAEIAGPNGRRTVPVEAVPTGPGRTSLAADEILVSLVVPPMAPRSGAKYLRFTPRREMDIAVAGVGGCVVLGGANAIASARLTLASVGPTPLRALAAEKALAGQPPSAALFAAAAEAAAEEARPISDTRGSAEYRRVLVAVLTRRVLAACVAEAGGTVA